MWKELHNELGKSIEFISVNVGINEKVDNVRKYVKSNGMTSRNIFDKDRKMIKSFGVMGTPTHIIIDRKGVVRYRGADAPEDLENHIKTLQNGKEIK